MSLVDDLPPVLSPLSPISPGTLTSVLGGTSPRCDMDYLIGDMRQQESRGSDVPSTAGTMSSRKTLWKSRGEIKTTESNAILPSLQVPRLPAKTLNDSDTKDSCTTSAPSSTSILNSLGSQPQFSGLQQVLQADLQNSPSSVPLSLLPPPSQSLASQKIPITSRAAMLQVSFTQLKTLFPASVSALRDFYHMQSASMETSRYKQLCLAENTAWIKPSINYYFDLEHHALIDSLESRLDCLKYGATLDPRSIPCNLSPAAVPTPPPAHTKVKVTKPAPAHVNSHIYKQLPTYTVPQALSTSPFLTALPWNSPTSGALNWFSTPPHQSSPQPVYSPRTFIPTSQAPETSAKRNPMNKPLSLIAVRVMQNWYDRNSEHPYPSHDTCTVMAKAGGITVEQVKKWFANKRLRNGQTKSIREIARRRKLPLDMTSTSDGKRVKIEKF